MEHKLYQLNTVNDEITSTDEHNSSNFTLVGILYLQFWQ